MERSRSTTDFPNAEGTHGSDTHRPLQQVAGNHTWCRQLGPVPSSIHPPLSTAAASAASSACFCLMVSSGVPVAHADVSVAHSTVGYRGGGADGHGVGTGRRFRYQARVRAKRDGKDPKTTAAPITDPAARAARARRVARAGRRAGARAGAVRRHCGQDRTASTCILRSDCAVRPRGPVAVSLRIPPAVIGRYG